MRIKKCNVLSEKQIKEVLDLQELCYSYEELENKVFLSNEINYYKELDCFYLAYEGGDLISFLTTFVPTSDEGEILGFTHPKFRNNGYFKALFKDACENLLQFNIHKVLFAIEPKSDNGVSFVKSFKEAVLIRSEYRMVYNKDEDLKCKLNFVKVDKSNKEIFSILLGEVFNDLKKDTRLADAVIDSENRSGFMALYNGKEVGTFSLNLEEGEMFLHAFGVHKDFRGKGFGEEIIKYAITEGKKRSKRIILDVDSNNPIAFNLYKKIGFVIEFQVDYYEYLIK
ncbi:MAG: GNAT family N-acetyltransferase [Clostridium sp.]